MRVSVKISAKKDLNQHMLVVGRSGSGKSMLLQTIAYDLIRKSNANRQFAVCIVDPHGDLARSCMTFAIQDRTRLYYLSSAINREANTPEGKNYTSVFNPFYIDEDLGSHNKQELRQILTETLTESLCELLTDSNLTVQMLSCLRPCLATVLRLDEIGKVPSLAELCRFYLEGANDDLVELGKTSDIEQHRIFFTHEWHNDNLAVSKKAIRVKLSYFLSDARLANMLCGKSTIDVEKVINGGGVLIVGLPKGSGAFTSKVMAKLLLSYIHALMLRRDAIEPELRKQLYVIADEFQGYVSTSLADSIAELRKYKFSLILATQSLMQLSDTVIRKTISVNASTLAVGLTDNSDRVTLSKELGQKVTPVDIEKLRPLQFFLKRNDGKHEAFKFNVPILSKVYFLTKKAKKELLNYLVYESGQYRLVPPPAPPPSSSPSSYKANTKPYKQPSKTDVGNTLKPRF